MGAEGGSCPLGRRRLAPLWRGGTHAVLIFIGRAIVTRGQSTWSRPKGPQRYRFSPTSPRSPCQKRHCRQSEPGSGMFYACESHSGVSGVGFSPSLLPCLGPSCPFSQPPRVDTRPLPSQTCSEVGNRDPLTARTGRCPAEGDEPACPVPGAECPDSRPPGSFWG